MHEVQAQAAASGLSLVEISLVDETGVLLVTAFRQPWLKRRAEAGMKVAVAGKIEFNYGFKRMTNPFIEEVGADGVQGMIIPCTVQPEDVGGARQARRGQRARADEGALSAPLPLDLRCKYRLMSRQAALACVHFPPHDGRGARSVAGWPTRLLLLELHLMMEEARSHADATPVRHVIEVPIWRR